MSSVEDCEPTYSSIDSLNTDKADEVLEEFSDDAHALTDDDEDKLKRERKLNADNFRLCTAKAAQDAVLGKIDASLAKKTLIATEAPHLHTKSLIAEPDDVAKTTDLDVSTILAEQTKYPVIRTVRSWLGK